MPLMDLEWRIISENEVETRRWQLRLGSGVETFFRIKIPKDKRTKTKAVVYMGMEYPSGDERGKMSYRVHKHFDSVEDAMQFVKSARLMHERELPR